jgi:hypothetical protein
MESILIYNIINNNIYVIIDYVFFSKGINNVNNVHTSDYKKRTTHRLIDKGFSNVQNNAPSTRNPAMDTQGSMCGLIIQVRG